MAPAHRLPLLRFFIVQRINIAPFRKPSRVLFMWGQKPPNPTHRSKHANFQGAACLGEDSRIRPLFLSSPGTLLGCDRRPLLNGTRKAELTWHLLCQRRPAQPALQRFRPSCERSQCPQVAAARPWHCESRAVSPQLTNPASGIYRKGRGFPAATGKDEEQSLSAPCDRKTLLP